MFEIYPAVDVRHGLVVRLQEGDPSRQTVFDSDPVAVAKRWAAMKPHWLHIVNLDGAFADSASPTAWEQLLPAICKIGPRVQFGGGIRSMKAIESALGLGVARVVLGTVAVEQPDLVEKAISKFGGKSIAVGLDTRNGQVQVRGWKEDGGISAVELGKKMKSLGVETVVHTDISRDGLLTGANAKASADLAMATGLKVVVSGGVAGIDDIRQSKAVADQGVVGVIAGRALYQGTLDLKQAIDLIAQ